MPEFAAPMYNQSARVPWIATTLLACALAGAASSGLAQETTAPGAGTPFQMAQSTLPSTSSSSATCLSGCSSQSFNCQNTCIATITGFTVVPSITVLGTTSNPSQCQQNCSIQQQVCQSNCSLR
jgi:hypothetical protein